MKPPQSTILFKDVPSNTTNWLVGIDTKFFNINQLLKGIKLIPDGLHFVHYSIPSTSSPETALESSIRYGFWIHCDNDVIVLRWNVGTENFDIITENDPEEALNYSKYVSDLGEVYPYTVLYPGNEANWKELIKYIDMEVVQEFFPFQNDHYSQEINTITPSKEENMVLMDQLQQRSAKLDTLDQSESELKYTIIQFMMNRKKPEEPKAVESISNDFLDKSWYLDQLYGNDLDLLLGELQLSFIAFIILGNFCSGMQWLNIIKLLLMSKGFMTSSLSFNLKFLTVFDLQLQVLPDEYIGEEISLNSAIDTKTFVATMENFVRDIFPKGWNNDNCCGKMKVSGMITEKWIKVTKTIHQKFNIDLDKLANSELDEDQFEVFDLKDYDENDEDVPTII